MKPKTLETLEEGMVVKGVIKNITEYGAFVDLGGIDGLLHITDMCWGRVNHPSEVFKVGDEVTVKVLKYNPETERVSLGLKQTQEDPWNHAEEAYPAGQEGPRQGHVDHRLRRLRRAGAGRRGPHPRQRDELDQEGQAPVEAARGRPGDRVPGARGRREGQAHPPRPQAARARSLDALHREVPARRQDRRQGPLASPTTASSSASKRASTAWSTRATCRGRSRSTTRPTSTTRATTSRRSSSRSTTTRRRSPSASSSSGTIPWPTIFNEFPPGQGRRHEGRLASSTTACSFASATASRGTSPRTSSSRRRTRPARSFPFEIGDEIKAEIANVDSQDRRLTLSMRIGEAGRPRQASEKTPVRRPQGQGGRRRRRRQGDVDRRAHQAEAR